MQSVVADLSDIASSIARRIAWDVPQLLFFGPATVGNEEEAGDFDPKAHTSVSRYLLQYRKTDNKSDET